MSGLLLAEACAVHAAEKKSSDAATILTTVGYLTGAADACHVAAEDSSILSNAIKIAIQGGKYGKTADAEAFLDRARRRGVADVEARKLDCKKIGVTLQRFVQGLSAE